MLSQTHPSPPNLFISQTCCKTDQNTPPNAVVLSNALVSVPINTNEQGELYPLPLFWTGIGRSWKLIFLFLFFCTNISNLFAQNQAPFVDTLSHCTAIMTPIVICNPYTDPNGDPVAIVDGYTTFNCSLTFLSDSCIRYTPLPAFSGTDTVFLQICDNQVPNACSESVIIVHVGCIAPIAQNDQLTISPTSVIINSQVINTNNGYNGVTIDVGVNDDPICNNTLQVTELDNLPAHGDFEINQTHITYIPDAGFTGTDQFSYIICNDCNKCDTATVNINIQAQTGTQCTNNYNDCTSPFTPLQLCPAFCNLPANQIATISADALNGSLNLPQNDCFTYIPDAVFTGTDIVTFIACNTNATVCDTTHIVVTISETCGSNPPIAQDDILQSVFDLTVVIDATNNDSDPDGQTFEITSFTQPLHGELLLLGNVFIYTPDGGFVGEDSFVYTICDEIGMCDVAVVQLNIVEPCENLTYEFCTPNFTQPVDICVQFCDLTGTEGIHIEHASTTFNCSIHVLNDSCIRYTPLPGFVGTDWVTLVGCNNAGLCDTITATVNVGCTVPHAANDAVTTNNNSTVNINVLTNDVEECGYTLSSAMLFPPQHGSSSLNPDGSFSYTPNNNYTGTDMVTYLSCNNCTPARCDTAVIFITIENNEDTTDIVLPNIYAQPDVVQTRFNTSITIPIFANDLGEGFVIDAFSLPSHGAVATVPGQGLLYVPENNFSGIDYFTYQICNANNECSQTLVSITVLPQGAPQQAPYAHNDLATTNLGIMVNIHPLWNDNDPENGNLFFQANDPEHGTITQSGSVITYTPDNGFSGIDVFDYVLCDNVMLCDTAQIVVAVGVNFENHYPLAYNDNQTASIGDPTNADLLLNDVEPDNNPLSITIISPPAYGTASINPNNLIATYTPTANFDGLDYFIYMICDNQFPILCDTAYVTITVGEGNVAPIAQNDIVFNTQNESITIHPLSNDGDANNPDSELNISITEQGQHGNATSNGQQINYSPQNNFVGTDTITYTVCDPNNLCDTAQIYITTELPPNAQPDLKNTTINTVVNIQVLSNDEGSNIIITTVSDPEHGTTSINSNGTIAYIPDEGFIGEDYFEYQICNSQGYCDEAIVNITVSNTNNLPPNAVNDIASTTLNTSVEIFVTTNDSDPNEPIANITISNVQQGQHGTTFVINNGTTIIYMPNPTFMGIDTFEYQLCDNGTPPLCDIATVAVSVGTGQLPNQAPIALSDYENTELNVSVNISVLNNDFDPNPNDTIHVSDYTTPQHGNIVWQNNFFIYTPTTNFQGTDFFIYTICDNGIPNLCDTAFVQIVVTPSTNSADIIDFTNEDEDIIFCIEDYLNLPSSIDTIIIYSTPQNGSPYYVPNNACIAYSPEQNFVGTDQFSIGLCSDNGICDTINIGIIITPKNDIPIANDDTAITDMNTSVNINVIINDIEPDNEEIDLVLVSDALNGITEITPQGILYIPNANFWGNDTFTYTIIDPLGWSSEATVIVTVINNQISNNIQAIDDNKTIEINTPILINVLSNDIYSTDATIGMSILTQPQHGAATLNISSINYTPAINFQGEDSFVYVICSNAICDTATVWIVVSTDEEQNCIPEIAQAFSPNNDNINDTWLIGNLNNCAEKISLKIYNRWGDLVYFVQEYNNTKAWNGTNNNKDVPDGSYFYILDLDYTKDDNNKLSGFIELKR